MDTATRQGAARGQGADRSRQKINGIQTATTSFKTDFNKL
jgi:hypothetical protein